jgi:hypothetical protein
MRRFILAFKKQNSFVAFLDVLGFKEMVLNKNPENEKKLKTYFDKVLIAFNVFSDHKQKLKKLILSDSVILIVEDKRENFKTLLTAIRNLQSWLAIDDIWLRGAISYGEISFDEKNKIIYGSGYIRAYLLEQQANYPRVIIDPRLMSKVSENRDEFLKLYSSFYNYSRFTVNNYKELADDSDKDYIYARFNQGKNTDKKELDEDVFFVNYATSIISNGIADCVGENHEGVMRGLIDNLKKEIYSDHFQKHNWTKKYFLDNLSNFDDKYSMGSFSLKVQKLVYQWRKELLKL